MVSQTFEMPPNVLPSPKSISSDSSQLVSDNLPTQYESHKPDRKRLINQDELSNSSSIEEVSEVKLSKSPSSDAVHNDFGKFRDSEKSVVIKEDLGSNFLSEREVQIEIDSEGISKPSLPCPIPRAKYSYEKISNQENDPDENLERIGQRTSTLCLLDNASYSSPGQFTPDTSETFSTENKNTKLEDFNGCEFAPKSNEYSGHEATEEELEVISAETKQNTSVSYAEGNSSLNLHDTYDHIQKAQNLSDRDKITFFADENSASTEEIQCQTEFAITTQYLDETDEKASQLYSESSCHLPKAQKLKFESNNHYDENIKKEMYDIKKINSCGQKSKGISNVRPILVQNSNGPCPLLALVNVLTLSASAGLNTPLIETLRSREQVSLGLLLNAVFDEITSDRQGNTTIESSDVTDLYSFLINLHTGMNVNPSFFPTLLDDAHEKSVSKDRASKVEKIAGSFEMTREMKLYSSFNISIIHGWLPQPDSPEYSALYRSAKTYEEAQNMILMHDTLEDKLNSEGLNLEEQTLLQDILTIKAFFESHATQLTSYGLESIRCSLIPGTYAILFRNNHFSTLYRHPETLQLLQLVTDAGYGKNCNVIWESLVDVTGEHTKYYSGDFRLSGDIPALEQLDPQIQNSGGADRSSNQPSKLTLDEQIYDQLRQTRKKEQEDLDLALALHLQEEEERRHKAAVIKHRHTVEPPQQQIRENQSSMEVHRALKRNKSLKTAIDVMESMPSIAQKSFESRPKSKINSVGENDLPPPSYELTTTQKASKPPAMNFSNLDSNSCRSESSQRVDEVAKTDEINCKGEKIVKPRDRVLHSLNVVRTSGRPDSVQGMKDKVISGQGRVQKDCMMM